MDIISELSAKGWYISNKGLEICKEGSNQIDVNGIIQKSLDIDLREIGGKFFPDELNRGKLDSISGSAVVQIQKIKNASAPKYEYGSGAPPILRLLLTDGNVFVNCLQWGPWKSINMDTPPGTKIYLKPGKLPMQNNFLLLSENQFNFLGGHVAHMVEKWDLQRQLASHVRTKGALDGNGPPPWIPFGKPITAEKQPMKGKNFRSLDTENKEIKEEDEAFKQQRLANIAEVARVKEGKPKVFGGGKDIKQNNSKPDASSSSHTYSGFTNDVTSQAKHYRNFNDTGSRQPVKSQNDFKTPRNNNYSQNDGIWSNLDSTQTQNLHDNVNQGQSYSRDKRMDQKGKSQNDFKTSRNNSNQDDGIWSNLDSTQTQNLHDNVNQGQSYPRDKRMDQKNKSQNDFRNNRNSDYQNSKSFDFQNTKNHNFQNVRSHGSQNAKGNDFPNARGHDFQNSKGHDFQSARGHDFQNSRGHDFQNSRGHDFQNARGHDFQNARGHDFQTSKHQNFQNTKNPDFHNSKNSGFQNHRNSSFHNNKNSDFQNSRNYNQGITNRENDCGADSFKKYSQNSPNFYENSKTNRPHESDYRNVEDLSQMVSNVKLHGYDNPNKTVTIPEKPFIQVGADVLAKYWEDSVFYPAEITAVGPEGKTCVVFFSEYGNYEEILIDDIKQAPPDSTPLSVVHSAGWNAGPISFQPSHWNGRFKDQDDRPTSDFNDNRRRSSGQGQRRHDGQKSQRHDSRPSAKLYLPPRQRQI